MRYEVFLTRDAERDLEDIYQYLAENESSARAADLLERLVEVTETLGAFPERGVQPKELRDIGGYGYRQLSFKPYRLIYRAHDARVVIYVVADGRRDMQALLARRLLGS